MYKIPFRILGFALILWGLRIFLDPVYYSSGFGVTFDYTDINIPLGLIIAAIGIFFVWSSFKSRPKNINK